MASVTIPLPSGASVSGELVLPPGDTRGPGLVLYHEWWGLNEQMKATAARFAGEGFVALALDCYHGKLTTDATDAGKLSQALDTALVMRETEAAAAWLKGDARCTGKVGTVGFCLGGALAMASANVTGVSAAVAFYGIPKPEFQKWSKATAPIQGHFGSKDQWATVDKANAVATAVRAAGGQMEVFSYEAGHAFMREGDPAAYVADAATTAWGRCLAFLSTQLRA